MFPWLAVYSVTVPSICLGNQIRGNGIALYCTRQLGTRLKAPKVSQWGARVCLCLGHPHRFISLFLNFSGAGRLGWLGYVQLGLSGRTLESGLAGLSLHCCRWAGLGLLGLLQECETFFFYYFYFILLGTIRTWDRLGCLGWIRLKRIERGGWYPYLYVPMEGRVGFKV